MDSVKLLCLLLAFLPPVLGQDDNANVALLINATETIAETDDSFICATIDWWPKDKCSYNQCPWGSSSILNLDLSHPLLSSAVGAFKQLRLRLGGSLQDQVHYDVGNSKYCSSFTKQSGGLFGFSKGCLHMKRWDELNDFFKRTGVVVTFGLNALYGRHKSTKSAWIGNWDSSNAYDFIKYTVSKGYLVDSWEFGNELSGKGIGASVSADQYAKDVKKLNAIIDNLYKNIYLKPRIVAPGGFYDKDWYSKFLQASGPHVVNVVTHHIYNLGAGNDRNLVNKILNPDYLEKVSDTFKSLNQTIEKNGPWASAWVGESGGAYNNGGHNVSDTFVNSFWYLDQLGMAAKYNTKVYCRQTLTGGNYALLDTDTLEPNPDYYSALLWDRLMGTGVLDVESDEPYLRSYAHCSKGRLGITLLLINLSNQTEFQVEVQSLTHKSLVIEEKTSKTKNSFLRGLKKSVSWVGSKSEVNKLVREEYHLTPKDGDLQSKTMLLNGNLLKFMPGGDIASLKPIHVVMTSQISISPLSIKFIVLPNFSAPACNS